MSAIIESLFSALPTVCDHHAPSSKLYALLKQVARKEVSDLFSSLEAVVRDFKPFGSLTFPYHNMGAVDSINLFDLDELLIFSFYWTNRHRYKRILDLGANIGLHSVILSKCGFEIRAYEPDPVHYELLQRNLSLNSCANVEAFNVAVSVRPGTMEFVRVIGNTTGSHLSGAKANPYGPLERFPVKVESIEPMLHWADLVKMDVEGHEKEILLATHRDHWSMTDALVEIQSEGNAAAVYQHLSSLGVNLFSQKINWQQVRELTDMPTSHHEGTLFITCKNEMPWD